LAASVGIGAGGGRLRDPAGKLDEVGMDTAEDTGGAFAWEGAVESKIEGMTEACSLASRFAACFADCLAAPSARFAFASSLLS
jgi:hypothetical protein